ncbi:MAG: hypothetical protein RL398_990 [Planctomycetota bacterium]
MPIHAMARMEEHTRRVTWKTAVVGFALAFAALVVGGCRGSVGAGAAAAVPPALAAALEGRATRVVPLDAETEVPQLAVGSTAVLWAEGEHASGSLLSPPVRARLLQHVELGGRLVLLGHAAAVAAELGIEPEWPEREVVRWGFDRRTALGRAKLGIEVTSGRRPEWFDGLAPVGDREFTHFLVAREPCNEPICTWTEGSPQRGEVLAQLVRELDGRGLERDAPVLVRWRHGDGELVALGLVPDTASEDATVRSNATRLLQNVLARSAAERTAAAADRSSLTLLTLAAAPLPPPSPASLDLGTRELPAAPQVAHWGWQATLTAGGDLGSARPPHELVDGVILPSWAAGADLLSVRMIHRELGSPLPWRSTDPLRPPAGFRNAGAPEGWHARAFGDLAAEAHARGMLVHGELDPLPVEAQATERAVAIRFFARELADLRRSGARAFDGFFVREWWNDRAGFGAAMVQDFHPGGVFLRSGMAASAGAADLWVADADDGTPAGLPFGGMSSTWRGNFAADLQPLAVLDARGLRSPLATAHDLAGGGSEPDWMVTQANDFVRARLGRGPGFWWRAHDPATLRPEAPAYAHGLGNEGLRTAVAMPLAATGPGGIRAAAAELLGEVQSGFGASGPAAPAVHALQNNWLQLLGSGGSLRFDPDGLARFGDAARMLSPALLRTRLFGARPQGDASGARDLDVRSGGLRGAGGYGSQYVVRAEPGADRRVPAALAFPGGGEWPQRVVVEIEPMLGYHELEVQLRGVTGRGLCAVRWDGVLLQCLPFVTGERVTPRVVPLHVARAGVRRLEFEVVAGGSVAVDQARLVRRGEVGAEARVEAAAGSLAELVERSASNYHAEELRMAMLADQPGVLLRLRCERAVRNLQAERTFALPQHPVLGARDDAVDDLRRPFVLVGSDAATPDLVVVPLLLGRNERLRFGPEGLQWVAAPEPGAESRLGLMLVPHGRGAALRAAVRQVFEALDRPTVLEVGNGLDVVLAHELPMAWTRVVKVQDGARTPYAVRENGWWTWRGTQPAGDGSAWLRVVHLPGDTVAVAGGPSLLARTRPGPGSSRLVALRDPQADGVTVRILQQSLLAQPAVTMAAEFGEVFVDDRPWSWFDGRTVYLPDAPGDHRVRTVRDAGPPRPHVRATSAPLRRCEFDPTTKTLRLSTAFDATRPVELPYTAILGGPRPTQVDNGEIVAEDVLRHADAQVRAAAAAGGTLIRFRAGETKVTYGDAK